MFHVWIRMSSFNHVQNMLSTSYACGMPIAHLIFYRQAAVRWKCAKRHSQQRTCFCCDAWYVAAVHENAASVYLDPIGPRSGISRPPRTAPRHPTVPDVRIPTSAVNAPHRGARGVYRRRKIARIESVVHRPCTPVSMKLGYKGVPNSLCRISSVLRSSP